MRKVAVARTSEARYPSSSPYHPYQLFPEYPFQTHIAREPNYAYQGIRELFHLLELDEKHWGSKEWNPLGFLVSPGMSVVIKPNFVLSRHSEGKDLFSIITHPSVIRAIIDYCWIALKGHGEILIADAPQYNCNFQELVRETHLDQVVDFFQMFNGPRVNLLDLRNYWSKGRHFPSMCKPLAGDPKGCLTVNLGANSALYDKSSPRKFYGAVYHRNETISHHSCETQEYILSRTVMDADVVISVPKLKVHKKVGVTLNAKGLVGVATNKNCLVHYSLTSPSEGGDQYPNGHFTKLETWLIKLERWMYDHLLARRNLFLEYLHRSAYWFHGHTLKHLGIKVDNSKRLLDAGNWYGNDSAWRMTVDLMKIFLFADSRGRLCTRPQRKMFSIIDGIIGGDNKGPLTPDPVNSGLLIAGDNFLAVDLVATRLMGFDPLKVRIHKSLLTDPNFDFGVRNLCEIQVLSLDPLLANCLRDTTNSFVDFNPHPGWIGHLEIRPTVHVV